MMSPGRPGYQHPIFILGEKDNMDEIFENHIETKMEMRASRDYSPLRRKFAAVTEHPIEYLEKAITEMSYYDASRNKFTRFAKNIAITGLIFRGKEALYPCVAYKCVLDNEIPDIEYKEIPLWDLLPHRREMKPEPVLKKKERSIDKRHGRHYGRR